MSTDSASPLREAIRALAVGAPFDGAAVTAAFDVVMRGDATPAQISRPARGVARARGERRRHRRRRAVAARGDGPASVGRPGSTRRHVRHGRRRRADVQHLDGRRSRRRGRRCARREARQSLVHVAIGKRRRARSVGRADRAADRRAATLARRGRPSCSCIAPAMHPAMRHVGPVRRELGIPTVMNVVGPLANPASAGRQVVGVADPARVPTHRRGARGARQLARARRPRRAGAGRDLAVQA